MLNLSSTSAIAMLALIGTIEIANAGTRRLPPSGTFVSCKNTCTIGANGRRDAYRVCTNNLTGVIVGITPILSAHVHCM